MVSQGRKLWILIDADIESSSDKDLSDSFHDLSDDESNISLNDFRPVCRHEQKEQEEAMAGGFLESDFPFRSGKWVLVAFATRNTMLISSHPRVNDTLP
jgi:hypothetical protein